MADSSNISSDIPITKKSQDSLGFEKYVSELARYADSHEVIGIYGDWGTGKTSLLNLLREKIKEIRLEKNNKSANEEDNKNKTSDEKVLIVSFNAWQYEKEEHPLVPLVSQIIDVIEANGTIIENIVQKVKYGFLSLLKAIRVDGKVGVSNETSVGAEIDFGKISEYYTEYIQKKRLEQTLYEIIFELLNNIAANWEKDNIVVIIDDLDRTLPDKAIHLLESIKLILNQSFITFYIAVNKKIIEEFVNNKFKERYKVDAYSTDTYLEKLIHVSFDIPNHRGQIDSLYLSLLDSLSIESAFVKKTDFKRFIFDIAEYNPRKLKRFLFNALIKYNIFNSEKNNKDKEQEIDFYFFLITYIFSTKKINKVWAEIEANETNLLELFINKLEKKDKEIVKLLKTNIVALEDFFSNENKENRTVTLYFTEQIGVYGGTTIITNNLNDIVQAKIQSTKPEEVIVFEKEKIYSLNKENGVAYADVEDILKNRSDIYILFAENTSVSPNFETLVGRIIGNNKLSKKTTFFDCFEEGSSPSVKVNNQIYNEISKKIKKC